MYAAFGVLSGTATIAEAVSCEPTAMTSSGAPTARSRVAREAAEVRAGIDERGQDGCRNAEPLGELEVPLARADIDQAGGRRVGALGDAGAGEEERDEVGDEERDVGLGRACSVAYWYSVLNGRNCRPLRR